MPTWSFTSRMFSLKSVASKIYRPYLFPFLERWQKLIPDELKNWSLQWRVKNQKGLYITMPYHTIPYTITYHPSLFLSSVDQHYKRKETVCQRTPVILKLTIARTWRRCQTRFKLRNLNTSNLLSEYVLSFPF
jgi:hypothetical protein